mmetsp:Transcript_23809/g.42930  ORF Transcript_23809/g.42930 Transcript_23809/m.42930 type:complete len:289 (+) Transcript_23809:4260-5126(+)
MRLDQIIAHVIGVAGGEPDAFQPIDLVQIPDQLSQCIVGPVRTRPVIGIHVLTQQSDLAHAPFHQITGLIQDAGRRTANFGAARIGNHAEGTELVTAFLHSQKRGWGAPRLGPAFQLFKLVFLGEVGVEGLLPGPGLGLHLGQAVIALRANHHIDGGLTAHDLFALGLRNTACDTDFQIGVACFELLETPEFRIDLFRRLFADMASVQQDHIGVVGLGRLDISLPAQRLGHAFAVIDIHLATIGLDEELFWRRHSAVPGLLSQIAALSRRAAACNAPKINRFCARHVH